MADEERFVRAKGTTRLFEHAGHLGVTGKWFTPASGPTVPVRKAADEAPHWVTIDGNPVLIGAGSRRKPYSKAYPLWEYAPSLGKDIPYRIAPRPPGYKGSRHWYSPDFLPDAIKQDLKTAMAKEGVSDSQYDDLAWIVMQESFGQVGVRNRPKSGHQDSGARGLFQLKPENYHYNPNGVSSFGNGVEECQGGIRYMLYKFGNAANAKAYWKENGNW